MGLSSASSSAIGRFFFFYLGARTVHTNRACTRLKLIPERLAIATLLAADRSLILCMTTAVSCTF